jgi:hypothetical protein
MSHAKPPAEPNDPNLVWLREDKLGDHLGPEMLQLLEMAHQLGPQDRIALANIIRRANEICESDGEEVALAVLDQIHGILKGRSSDA